MKNRIFSRAAAAVLATVMLLLCVSCDGHRDEPENSAQNEQRLTVELVPAVYSQETIQQSSREIVALLGRVIRMGGGPILDATQKQKLCDRVEAVVLPRLAQQRIYEEELMALLSVAEEICSAAESGEMADSSPAFLLFRFYQSGLSAVDAQRLGGVLYCLMEAWLEYRIDYCYERYNKYHYEWYLKDAHGYERQLTELRELLGEETFSKMTAMLMFGASLGMGVWSESGQNEVSFFSDGELILLVQRQAGYFAEMEISSEQWSAMVGLYAEWLPTKGSNLLGAQVAALHACGYAQEAATVLPCVLELYRAMSLDLTEEELSALDSQDPTVRTAAVSRLLVSSKDRLLLLNGAWAACGTSESDDELAVLKQMGLEEAYTSFLAANPAVGVSELIEAAEVCATRADAESADAFRASMLGYIRAYVPCMAFALFQSCTEGEG